MFHTNAPHALPEGQAPQATRSTGLRLVSSSILSSKTRSEADRPSHSQVPDLLLIASRRCSSFFAEAAVLVLVFGILDYFMLKGRIEGAWIAGALAISLGLLGASIATDFSAHRWMKAHP